MKHIFFTKGKQLAAVIILCVLCMACGSEREEQGTAVAGRLGDTAYYIGRVMTRENRGHCILYTALFKQETLIPWFQDETKQEIEDYAESVKGELTEVWEEDSLIPKGLVIEMENMVYQSLNRSLNTNNWEEAQQSIYFQTMRKLGEEKWHPNTKELKELFPGIPYDNIDAHSVYCMYRDVAGLEYCYDLFHIPAAGRDQYLLAIDSGGTAGICYLILTELVNGELVTISEFEAQNAGYGRVIQYEGDFYYIFLQNNDSLKIYDGVRIYKLGENMAYENLLIKYLPDAFVRKNLYSTSEGRKWDSYIEDIQEEIISGKYIINGSNQGECRVYVGDEEEVAEPFVVPESRKLYESRPSNTYHQMDFTNTGVPIYMRKSKFYPTNTSDTWHLTSRFYLKNPRDDSIVEIEEMALPYSGASSGEPVFVQMWFKELEGKVYTFCLYHVSDYNYMLNVVRFEGTEVNRVRTDIWSPRRHFVLTEGELADNFKLSEIYDADVVSDFLSMDAEAFEKQHDKNALYEKDILYCTKEAWKYDGGQLDGFQAPEDYYEVEDIRAIRFINLHMTGMDTYTETDDVGDVKNRVFLKYYEDYAVSMYFRETKDVLGEDELELTEVSFVKVKSGEDDSRVKKLYEFLEGGYYEVQEEIETEEWEESPKGEKAVCISNGELPKHPSQIFVRYHEKKPDLIFRGTWEWHFAGWIDEEHFICYNDFGPYLIHIETDRIEEIKTEADDYDAYGCRYEIRGNQLIATVLDEEYYCWDIVREGGEVRLVKHPDGGEGALLDKMQSAARHGMDQYMYVDMDHDGAKEMVGVYLDEEEQYRAWYCSSDGQVCMQVYQNENQRGWDGCALEALDIGEETHIVVNAFLLLGTSKTYTILALRDKEMECLAADQYGYVWMSDEGDILLDVEDYDGMYEPTDDGGGVMSMHTWIDTYLFYEDGVYKEYGATKIAETEFLTYENAQMLKDKIGEELRQPDTVSMEYSYFKRKNGIMHIQCDIQADSGVIRFGYYTVRYKGNVLEEELGEYNPGRMCGSLASWAGLGEDGIEVVY